MYELLAEAIRYGWIACAHTQAITTTEAAKLDAHAYRFATIKNKGLKYSHTYTLLAMKKVTLANNYNDVVMLFRNPWGKDQRGPQWRGDWGQNDDLWTKHTKKQLEEYQHLMTENTFWMSLEDFIEYFRSFTICQNDPQIRSRIVPADIETFGKDGVSYTGWAVLQLRFRGNGQNVCFRLCQMDRRFLEDQNQLLTFEYAMMTMFVVKKARVPPRTEYGTATQEFCYLEG